MIAQCNPCEVAVCLPQPRREPVPVAVQDAHGLRSAVASIASAAEGLQDLDELGEASGQVSLLVGIEPSQRPGEIDAGPALVLRLGLQPVPEYLL